MLPKRLKFPLIVKSLTYESSIGISQASVVANEDQLGKRVQFIHDTIMTPAIVEQFIDGRELYVGVMGNDRLQVFPVWEMSFAKMPENSWHIATERVKWSVKYQKKHGIDTDRGGAARRGDAPGPAPGQARLPGAGAHRLRAHRLPDDARDNSCIVIEANPNPQLAQGEDFAESARRAGVSYARLLERIIGLGLQWQPSRMA